MTGKSLVGLVAAVGVLCGGHVMTAAAKPPTTFSPVVEAQNFSITQQRQTIYDTPQYQAQLAADSAASTAQALATEAADPGRFFTDDLCWNLSNGCAGDIRLNNWATNGYGLVRPVLFTARDGATISGHVWATVAGPAKRPGHRDHRRIGPGRREHVLVRRPGAGQGRLRRADLRPPGPGPVGHVRPVARPGRGRAGADRGTPFYDGTEDAIDFLLSTPQHPYEPVPSCTTGTSHAAKQNSRVAAGLDAAYNPLWSLLDPSEIGLAGHSYGAAGVSYIGQWDPRVKAIVAWDNLGGPGPDDSPVPGAAPGAPSQTIGENGCPADPADRTTVPITKPALGMSADYGLPPAPNTSLPNPEGKSTWSLNYSKAGVDTGEIIIRGGSHLDFSFIPNQAFGASLRGPDLIAWYTTAWFDKYLKHAPGADAQLLTQRWRDDPIEAGIDPNHDGNAFSFYYYSRLDIHLANGKVWDCEDLRDGCPGMVPESGDGFPGTYSYLKVDTSPDGS